MDEALKKHLLTPRTPLIEAARRGRPEQVPSKQRVGGRIPPGAPELAAGRAPARSHAWAAASSARLISSVASAPSAGWGAIGSPTSNPWSRRPALTHAASAYF